MPNRPSGCIAFAWIGQPLSHCDNCSKPAWTHDFDERAPKDAGPFTALEPVPWSEKVIGRWLEQGVIDRRRAAHLLIVEAPSDTAALGAIPGQQQRRGLTAAQEDSNQ